VSSKNLAWAVIDRLFLTAYGPDDPTDQEWDAYLRAIEQHGIVRTMQLVITDGAAPTRAQRRRLERLVTGHEVPVAVLSESTAVRVMVSAFAKLNRRLRAFAPADLAEALAFLEVPSSRVALIEREINCLRRSLGRGGET
jgi:metallophosphoesterase superfamily enzyme